MATFTKCKRADDDVVVRLRVDESDPDDRATHTRDLVAAFWRDMGALARRRAADEQRDRVFARVFDEVRAEIMAPVERAAQSYGVGLVPLVALRRLRGGAVWPA